VKAARLSVPALLDRLLPSEAAVMWGTATLVGLGTGAGAILFIRLIQWVQNAVYQTGPSALPGLASGWILLGPVLGGLVAGPIIAFFAREAKGHGVPEVMQAIALRGGRMRPRLVVAKVLASAACIGSGGSAGREGPIVQVGAALGSSLAQAFRFSEARIRNLVACGAAAGISATFNAPIAGVIFSLEIVLGELRLGDLSSVVISAVTAAVLARSVLGDRPAFSIPKYTLVSPWEILFYMALGVLAALVGILFIKLLYAVEAAFDGWRFPEALKPAVGGLLLGLLGLGYPLVLQALGAGAQPVAAGAGLSLPHVYGAGFGPMEAALRGELPLLLLLSLVPLKLLATSLTLGSGNSGGVFAPGLFTGAMLGGAFGHVVRQLFPAVTAGPGPYATVGMAAVFAAAARAPLTAILIVFEMTDDYRIILPLMASVMIATVIAQHAHTESIYTLKLARKGIRISRGRDVDVLESVRVQEVMNPQPAVVGADLPVSALPDLFLRTNSHSFAVLDGEDRLFGMVSLDDYRRASEGGSLPEGLTVGQIASRSLVVAYPDEPVGIVLRRMAPRDLARIPVISREDPRRMLGTVRRNDVIRAYELGTIRRATVPAPVLPERPGVETAEFTLQPGAALADKTLAEAGLPGECVVTAVFRQEQVLVPRGDTRLQAGDRVSLLLVGCQPEQVAPLFTAAGPGPAKEKQS
jgi:CIC family chloride channel protein